MVSSICVLGLWSLLCAGVMESKAETASSVPPPSGIVSWWRGNGNLSDEIGGNSGTSSSHVTYAGGYVGQGFAFSGTNGCGINVGVATNLQLQNLTIEAWVQRGSTTQATFDQGGFGDFFTYGQLGYGFGIANDGQLAFSKMACDLVISDATISDTNFHHIAFTKSDTQLVFYVDGVAYTYGAPYSSVFRILGLTGECLQMKGFS
jgi:hypothetical protein